MKRCPIAPLFVVAAILAAPVAAQARPVTRIVDLVVGSEQFFRVGADVLAFVDAPEVVGAEVLPSNELLLTPKAEGRALLYLMSPSTFDAVRVRVRATGGKLPEARASEESLQTVRKLCQNLTIERSPEGGSLSANVPNGACRKALLAVFDSDDFLADRISLIFSEDVLREQYEEIQTGAKAAGLDSDFKLAYLGPTLRIEGSCTPARKLELMKVVYRATPGRLLLDDRTEVSEPKPAEGPSPDAGASVDAAP